MLRPFQMLALSVLLGCVCTANTARAQSFGVELHNTLMPASGAMGGASIARPQDLQSAINGNPGTLTQFRGTQFSFGGGWAEPTINFDHAGGVLPNVGAFSGKSGTPGALLGNIGLTQDFSALGMPATFGMGFVGVGGGGVEFRDIPASNGTSSQLVMLGLTMGMGVDLTDNLSAGASVSLGNAFFDTPFVGLSAMVPDYALRAAVGANYRINCDTTIGAYYQSQQSYTFHDAISFDLGGGFSPTFDVSMDLPENLGFGIANSSLMEGKLLLSADLLYKLWDNADLFAPIYDDQLVVQLGAQYSMGKMRLRMGYAWAENPLQSPPGVNPGGVAPPGAIDAVQYLQAQLAVINEHRISAGVGMRDVLPGVDMDLFAGGMFEDFQQLGSTGVSIESWWVGFGLTWRFQRGSSECLGVCNNWGCM